jgi:hypothetical protein
VTNARAGTPGLAPGFKPCPVENRCHCAAAVVQLILRGNRNDRRYDDNRGQVGRRVNSKVRKTSARHVPLSKEDRFEYRLENDPRFLRRIERACGSLQAARGVRLEDLKTE